MTDQQTAEARAGLAKQLREWAAEFEPSTAEVDAEMRVYVDAADTIDALSVRLAQAERVAQCDCVPCLVSSKSCHKCGRKGTIPQEQMVRGINDLEARLAQAERQVENLAKYGGELLERVTSAEARLREYEEALLEARQYVLDWPIGTTDEPQEQRGGPRDTILRNLDVVLAASGGREAPKKET